MPSTTTSFRDHDTVMIEVGLNESVLKAQCPAVPVTVAEVVDDVVNARAVGAAVLHYHARDADGAVVWDEVDFYRDVMADVVARGCDAITYPTYLGSFEHIWRLHDTATAGHGLQMAPFDIIQNVGLSIWDEPSARFLPARLEGLGADKSVVPPVLEGIQRRGLGPVVAVFDIGQARWVSLAVRAGILVEPVNLKVFLHQGWVLGPTPSAVGLDAYLSELNGIDVEVTVVPSTMHDRQAWLDLIDTSLRRGVGIRVGLGDCPMIHQGMTNADLVAEAVQMMDKHGLAPATPGEVIARFGLPTRTM
jgi:3-keto-5-aminohexanoate cleavage enzyme